MTCCAVPIKWNRRNVPNGEMNEWNRNESEIETETPAPGRKHHTQNSAVWLHFFGRNLFQFGALNSSQLLDNIRVADCAYNCIEEISPNSIYMVVHGQCKFYWNVSNIRNNLELVAWISFDCTTPRCMHFVLIMQIEWIAYSECDHFIWIAHCLPAYWSSMQLRGDCCCYNLFVCFRLNSKAIIIWQRTRIVHKQKNYIHVDLMQNLNSQTTGQ